MLDGRKEIFVAPYPGPGEPKQVSLRGGQCPRFSRDGREQLFFVAGDTLMVASIETGPAIRVSAPVALFEAPMDASFPYDVHPDGDHFLVIESDPELVPDRLHVVLNWFDELERLIPVE